MIKTQESITRDLTANVEFQVDLVGTGSHVRIENRGEGIVYASKYPNVVACADNVIAIDSGVTKLLTDVCVHNIKDSLCAYRGSIYLLSDSDTSVEITTTNNANFKQVVRGGEYSSSLDLDTVLKSGVKYQLGILKSDITLTLPKTSASDIEVDFAVGDTVYAINCDYLSLIPVANTYYQILFSYDRVLQKWFPSIVSSDYTSASTASIAEVLTDET